MNELKEKLVALLLKAKAIVDAAEKDGDRAFTAEERQSVAAIETEAKALRDQIKQKQSDAEISASIQALGAGLENGSPAAPERKPGELILPEKGKSIGQQFAEAAEFKEWMGRVAPTGRLPESAKGLISPPVQFKSLITGLSDTSGGAMVFNDVQAGIQMLGRRPLTLRGVVTNGTTNSDTVEYVRVTSETNNAAPVAEATDVSGGSGVKPQSDLALVKVTETVKQIAHWFAITRRALADAGQIRTLIDNFGRYGLEEELEDQMINGSGVGENFIGLDTVSGTQDQAWDTDILTTTRKARTKIRTIGRSIPTAYLLHPNDWEKIDLLQDNEARYYYGGPQSMGIPRLWGLPVIESEALTEGFGWVGDFRKLVLWDREQASIMVSDSHQDFFIRNLLALLFEMRAAFGCLQPNAFVEIDLTA